jgi:hypothetical protein
MSAFVLILAIAMPSYDGGVAIQSVGFSTREACEAAAKQWNGDAVLGGHSRRGIVKAACHATGFEK